MRKPKICLNCQYWLGDKKEVQKQKLKNNLYLSPYVSSPLKGECVKYINYIRTTKNKIHYLHFTANFSCYYFKEEK